MTELPFSRGYFLSLLAGVLAGASPGALASPKEDWLSLTSIEARTGGKMGVFALDTGNGRSLSLRPDERFAMCSTFKWILAAAVLARVEEGRLSLVEQLAYGKDALLSYAPVTSQHVAEGFVTVSDLTRAAILVSDNTAANLLLSRLGGPSSVTAFSRSCGDEITRLDRNEPTLNDNDPGDPRDTTSPRAMVGLMRSVFCGYRLSKPHRDLLLSWMFDCETGRNRIRAGLPVDWRAGDKTGSGSHQAINDVVIAFPPGRSPILISVFMTGGDADTATLVAAHADIGRLAGRYFA